MHLISLSLEELLGVDKTFFGKPIGNEKHQFKYGVDLNTHGNQFYEFSDVANYTNIGNVTAPILRVIPFKYMQEEIRFHKEFLNLHYVPVAKSYIDQVHISMKGDTVEEFPFITQRIRKCMHEEQFVSMDCDSMIIPSVVVYQDNMAMVGFGSIIQAALKTIARI